MAYEIGGEWLIDSIFPADDFAIKVVEISLTRFLVMRERSGVTKCTLYKVEGKSYVELDSMNISLSPVSISGCKIYENQAFASFGVDGATYIYLAWFDCTNDTITAVWTGGFPTPTAVSANVRVPMEYLENGKAIIAYNDGSSCYGRVLYDGGDDTIQSGTEVSIDTGNYHNIVALSSTSILFCVENSLSDEINAMVLTVSGTSISTNTAYDLPITYFLVMYMDLRKISSTRAVMSLSGDDAVTLIDISGTAISFNSLYATHGGSPNEIGVINSSEFFLADDNDLERYTISGSTITYQDSLVFNINLVNIVKLTKIDDYFVRATSKDSTGSVENGFHLSLINPDTWTSVVVASTELIGSLSSDVSIDLFISAPALTGSFVTDHIHLSWT